MLKDVRYVLRLLARAAALCLVVCGVLAYDVSQRRHEIGIRMALGADRGHVRQMILAGGVTLTIAGVAVGVAIAAIAARTASGLLR